MNDRQRRFAEEYIVDLNATQAAKRAGYSEKTAYSQGISLLRNPEIQAAVKENMQKRSDRVQISQDDVVRELAIIALADADDTPNSRLRFTNKIRALELLGKHLGMFTDRIALTSVDAAAIRAVEDLIHDATRSG